MNPYRVICSLAVCAVVASATVALAQIPPPTNSPSLLESWSFSDVTNWTDDYGDFALAWTNLAVIQGDGTAVLMDNRNGCWLQYPLQASDGSWTNLALTEGTLMGWFYLTNAANTNGWGLDPGQWGTFVEVGSWTPTASLGWWSLYTDGTNIYFGSQNSNGVAATYLSAPLNWNAASNTWQFFALTYSAGTNGTKLYLNGALVTNGPSIGPVPDVNVVGNSMSFGSSGTSNQLHAAFDDIWTYDAPVDPGTIASMYVVYSVVYYGTPVSSRLPALNPAPSSPSTNAITPDVITGAGSLQTNGPVSAHNYGANAYQVWITNVTATVVSNGATAISFTIEGGQDGYMYDVFATGALGSPLTNAVWDWMGQGGHFTNYTVNVTSPNAFLVLGTPLDSDSDGLTDAYELLVSHTNPHNPDSNLDGLLDGWEILLGLNPHVSNLTQPGERANYGYTSADWLNGVSGIKSGSIGLDNEGNVLSVSQ